jgi:D-aminoacyl-tRNA deacylase
VRAILQRVKEANVKVDGQIVSEIGRGIVTLLGVEKGDTEEQVRRMIEKIVQLRIFEDSEGKMNLSLIDKGFEHLIISQFTLLADYSKGKRPSFLKAESPIRANELYQLSLRFSTEAGIRTKEGVFGADMEVSLVNNGPATFLIEI